MQRIYLSTGMPAFPAMPRDKEQPFEFSGAEVILHYQNNPILQSFSPIQFKKLCEFIYLSAGGGNRKLGLGRGANINGSYLEAILPQLLFHTNLILEKGSLEFSSSDEISPIFYVSAAILLTIKNIFDESGFLVNKGWGEEDYLFLNGLLAKFLDINLHTLNQAERELLISIDYTLPMYIKPGESENLNANNAQQEEILPKVQYKKEDIKLFQSKFATPNVDPELAKLIFNTIEYKEHLLTSPPSEEGNKKEHVTDNQLSIFFGKNKPVCSQLEEVEKILQTNKEIISQRCDQRSLVAGATIFDASFILIAAVFFPSYIAMAALFPFLILGSYSKFYSGKNTWKFWKSHGEIFVEKQLACINNYKKQNGLEDKVNQDDKGSMSLPASPSSLSSTPTSSLSNSPQSTATSQGSPLLDRGMYRPHSFPQDNSLLPKPPKSPGYKSS